MARGRRGGTGSAARLANIMTGQAYQAAVERGKKSATGLGLKRRRKKMTAEADRLIDKAETDWQAELEQYEGSDVSKAASIYSTLASLVSMIPHPAIQSVAPYIQASALAAQAGGAYAQDRYTKDWFDKHKGEF